MMKMLLRSLLTCEDFRPIKSESALLPDLYILKMGIFPQIPKPQFETFAAHRHEWQGVHEGLVQFATVKDGKKLGE
jgi:hypothetical protein